MNNPAPRSQDELLTELSLRLSAGADACESADHGWLIGLLMAFIANWIREIAENLRNLAALIRDGKLVLQPPAPCQGTSRPAGKPTKRANRSPRMPGPATAATAQSVPLAEPETVAMPAEAPEPVSRTPRPSPDIREWTKPPPLRSPSLRVVSAHWPRVRPIPKNGLFQAGALARPNCSIIAT